MTAQGLKIPPPPPSERNIAVRDTTSIVPGQAAPDGTERVWIERARNTRLEHEARRRRWQLKPQGTKLVGPCPKCGGDDDRSAST
jgi:hypothetical protein